MACVCGGGHAQQTGSVNRFVAPLFGRRVPLKSADGSARGRQSVAYAFASLPVGGHRVVATRSFVALTLEVRRCASRTGMRALTAHSLLLSMLKLGAWDVFCAHVHVDVAVVFLDGIPDAIALRHRVPEQHRLGFLQSFPLFPVELAIASAGGEPAMTNTLCLAPRLRLNRSLMSR